MANLNEKELENSVDGMYGLLKHVEDNTKEVFSEKKEKYFVLHNLFSIYKYVHFCTASIGYRPKGKEDEKYNFDDLSVGSLEEMLSLVKTGVKFSDWGNGHKWVELYVRPPVKWHPAKCHIATFGYTCPQAPNKIFIGSPRLGPKEVSGGFRVSHVTIRKYCKYCNAEPAAKG